MTNYSSLVMSLDGIITHHKKRTHQRRARPPRSGSRSGHGRTYRFPSHNNKSARPSPYPLPLPTTTVMQEAEAIMKRNEGYNGESEAKLYISNLDYGVSSNDIKLLFSDVGEVRSQSVHYDKSGRSKGTAEVVFARQTDALAAIKKYNNLPLDGKPMIIELIGADSFTETSSTGKSEDVFKRLSYVGGQQSFGARGWGHVSIYYREFTKTQVQGRRRGEIPTAEELDADMDKYHIEGYLEKRS